MLDTIFPFRRWVLEMLIKVARNEQQIANLLIVQDARIQLLEQKLIEEKNEHREA